MTALTAFAGTTALVTGAGDGIGAMLARKLAASGMRVCVQDIRLEAAEAVAAELGDGAFALQADVSDRDSLAVAAESLRERGTVLNLLWLNAGVGAGSPVLEGNLCLAQAVVTGLSYLTSKMNWVLYIASLGGSFFFQAGWMFNATVNAE
ncbi:MAG: SDR family NAD(P)-dependent oxidoreductase, partial [Pseudomonadota bacterium]